MSARLKFEALAKNWDSQKRPSNLLLSGYGLIALRCWSWSTGGKADGMSDVLRAFMAASNASQHEDWLDDYMSDHESCGVCGDTFRFENLSLCTGCARRYCYQCAGQCAVSKNGNKACACGGEVVG